MRLSDIATIPDLDFIEVVAGGGDPQVHGVYTTDLGDPLAFLYGGELVLTSGLWYREPADAQTFVGALTGGHAAALVVGLAAIGEVPPPLVRACEEAGLALFAVEGAVSFRFLTETVMRVLAGAAGKLTLHRDLVADLASGEGPSGLVASLRRALGVDCAVITATGRMVAGGLTGTGSGELADAFRKALNEWTFPSAQRVGEQDDVSFFAVGSPVARRPAVAYVAIASDHRTQAPWMSAAVEEVCALLAMDRSTRYESRRLEERMVREVLARLQRHDSAGADSQFRSLGFDGEAPVSCIVVSSRDTRYGTELAGVILEEVHDEMPLSTAPVKLPTEAFLMFVGVDPELTSEAANSLSAQVRSIAQRLGPLLDRGYVAIGTGTPGHLPEGARVSMSEAEYTHRYATQGSGPIRFADNNSLSSHLLLVAAVPEEIKRVFRRRLIGVIADHDERHRTDLLATLQVFLEESGSWSRSAERLHIHVNTLRYRLQRVEKLTDRSLATLHDRVDFVLALSIAE